MPGQVLELRATFIRERFRFQNDDGDVIIAEFQRENGQMVTGKGKAGDGLIPAIPYLLVGYWNDYRNKRTGATERQFCFSSFAKQQPNSRAGTIAYLQKCGGIGPVIAARLWDAFGPDAVQKLRECPSECAEAPALGGRLRLDVAVEAAKRLEHDLLAETTTIALAGLLSGMGLPRTTAESALKKWGARAPEIIRKNPYQLMSLPRIGFRLADKVYLALGHPPGRLKRQALCLWHYLDSGNGSGDTWVYDGQARQEVTGSISGADPKFEKALAMMLRTRCIEATRTTGVAGPINWDGDTRWLASATKSRHEARIAASVARLQGPGRWPKVDEIHGLSDHQREILRQSLGGRIAILGGRPGTGKTYTAAALMRVLADLGLRTAVCAPTGKAAVRITEVLASYGLTTRAATIHRTLIVRSAEGGWTFEHTRCNPLREKFVIVDETSMADAGLMADLLDAVDDDSHILFVGDTHQLPPVGHGAPLRDLIAAGLPYGELREIRRNSGTIIQVCSAIVDGQPWEPDSETDIEAKKNLRLVHAPRPDDQITKLESCLMTAEQKYGFHPVWDVQVIVPVNEKSPLARKELNTRMQEWLNPSPPRKFCRFREGDKVVCLKNHYAEPGASSRAGRGNPSDTDEPAPTNDSGQPYVANGEIGEVLEFEHNDRGMVVELTAPLRRIYVPVSANKGDGGGEGGSLAHWDLAYAISCHKSQGSEFPVAIIMLDEYPGARRVAGREWIYTAISRAKQLCVLIGKKSTAEAMARRIDAAKRKTFLMERIGHARLENQAV